MDFANQVSFDLNNTDSICSALDQLLTVARKANKFVHSNGLSNDIFFTKIKVGILRLRRNGEHKLAQFYASELKTVKRLGYWKKSVPYVFVLVLLMFLFGKGKYIESLPKQPNPIEEFFN